MFAEALVLEDTVECKFGDTASACCSSAVNRQFCSSIYFLKSLQLCRNLLLLSHALFSLETEPISVNVSQIFMFLNPSVLDINDKRVQTCPCNES